MKDQQVPDPREVVDDHICSTATEFLDILSPRCNRMWESNASAWIFRGQADAEWSLKPTAVRDIKRFGKFGIPSPSSHPGYDPTGEPAWCQRAGFQNKLLIRFREGLDRAGLVIPIRSPPISDAERREQLSNDEPLSDAFPLMALAQHHGLPTMLLDWTRRAWVAAYFAAVEAADEDQRGSAMHLAVWALYRNGLVRPAEGPYFYEAPGGTNPNLHAQSGLFTLLAWEDDLSLEEHWARIEKITGAVPAIRRLILPVNEAPTLLRLLAEEGIHGASMFPGPDGVVRWMRESALWR